MGPILKLKRLGIPCTQPWIRKDIPILQAALAGLGYEADEAAIVSAYRDYSEHTLAMSWIPLLNDNQATKVCQRMIAEGVLVEKPEGT